MVIRTINSIVNKHGFDEHDCYRPILIVKDEENHYGIEDSDGNVFLRNEYDCITPLGQGMWLLCKNGLFGLMTLGDDVLCEARDNRAVHRIHQFKREAEEIGLEFRIMDLIPCNYDYVESVGSKAVKMCYYDNTRADDVYFRNTGRIMSGVSMCDYIHRDRMGSPFYFVTCKSPDSGEYEQILYNEVTDKISPLEKGYYPVSGGVTEYEGAFYLTCCNTKGNASIIYRLNGTKVEKSLIFDKIPTEIRPFDGEDFEGPLFYAGKRDNKTVFVDECFQEVTGLEISRELIQALIECSE